MVKHTNLLNISIKISKKLLRKYLYDLYSNKLKDLNDKATYSSWYESWKTCNKNLHILLEKNDSFYASLGVKTLEIMEACSILKKVLVKTSRTEQHYELTIYDKSLERSIGNYSILTIPLNYPWLLNQNHLM